MSLISFRVAQDAPCHFSRILGYFTLVAQDTPSLPPLTQAVGSGSVTRKEMRDSLGFVMEAGDSLSYPALGGEMWRTPQSVG